MFNIVLFGPPGSGKGTQSEKLVDAYSLIHLSTGDLLRNEIKNETLLGLQAKSLIDKGKLVPDEVVIGMISYALDAYPFAKGFLFDGFPRTESQAEALDALLKLRNTEISFVLALDVSENELVQRLLNRGLISGRSDDINEFVIKERIAEYHRKTTPVAEYYKRFNKLETINGEGSPEEIFKLLCKKIEKKSQFVNSDNING